MFLVFTENFIFLKYLKAKIGDRNIIIVILLNKFDLTTPMISIVNCLFDCLGITKITHDSHEVNEAEST